MTNIIDKGINAGSNDVSFCIKLLIQRADEILLQYEKELREKN